MNVTIEHTSPDGLQQERWTFAVWAGVGLGSGIEAVYDGYELLQRPSLRHKLKIRASWQRLRGRLGYKTDFQPLDQAPEVPQDVQAQVRAKVADAIVLVLKPQ